MSSRFEVLSHLRARLLNLMGCALIHGVLRGRFCLDTGHQDSGDALTYRSEISLNLGMVPAAYNPLLEHMIRCGGQEPVAGHGVIWQSFGPSAAIDISPGINQQRSINPNSIRSTFTSGALGRSRRELLWTPTSAPPLLDLPLSIG